MRLAFYTYSYTDRLNMRIEPALEKIAATGYDGIDISGTHGPSADPHSVTPELRTLTRATAASWATEGRRLRGSPAAPERHRPSKRSLRA